MCFLGMQNRNSIAKNNRRLQNIQSQKPCCWNKLPFSYIYRNEDQNPQAPKPQTF